MTALEYAKSAVQHAAKADREGNVARRPAIMAKAWGRIMEREPENLDAQYILGGADDDFRANDGLARMCRFG